MKKKILFINGHLNVGGVEKALLDILNHLDYTKYEVDLLLTETMGDLSNQLPNQVNVLFHSIEGAYGFLPYVIAKCILKRDWFCLKMRVIFLIMKIFGQKWIVLGKQLLSQKKEYDCVIGFRPGLCTQIAAYAINAKQRITWWHHGEVTVKQKEYLEVANRCNKVIVVSESCREMITNHFPLLREKMVTVNNMIDVNTINQKADECNPYLEKELIHIVSVGRLDPVKHFDNAIYAAKQLKQTGVRFKWHLVGDGELFKELREKALKLDVNDCFIFEGNQVNPYPYIKNADLFVHPSYVESFGIVVIEALVLKVPCVVTRSIGVMDFLVDGKNALITEQSPKSLTEKVIEVLKNPILYEELKKNATCPQKFKSEWVIKKIDDLM